MNNKTKSIIFWAGVIVATLFFGLLTIMSFSEWWTVKVKNEVDDYPWGPINNNPWYYNNADLYAKVMLTEGLLMLVSLLLTIWFLAHKQKSKALYLLITCFGLFLLMLINGQIK